MKRTLIAGLVTASMITGGIGPTAATARADNQGPFQWCPGQSMAFPPGPGRDMVWDMNICHTFYFVDFGKGNVPRNIPGPPEPWVWDGDNPPPSDRCYPRCL